MCYRASCCFAFFECVRAIEKEMMERKEKRENGEKRKTEKKKKSPLFPSAGLDLPGTKNQRKKKEKFVHFFPPRVSLSPFLAYKGFSLSASLWKKEPKPLVEKSSRCCLQIFLTLFLAFDQAFFFSEHQPANDVE